MKSKFFRLMAACLVAVLTLILFVQSHAFAKEADEGRSGLSRDFKPEKVKPSLSPWNETFKIPDGKIPKLPGDEKGSSARKPICAGLGCPPSSAEKLAKELRETLDNK